MVDLSDDVYGLDWNGTLDRHNGDVIERILEARAALRAGLAEPSMRSLVEVWNPERFNDNATVAENLLFGSPVGPVFAIDSMAETAMC